MDRFYFRVLIFITAIVLLQSCKVTDIMHLNVVIASYSHQKGIVPSVDISHECPHGRTSYQNGNPASANGSVQF